MPEAAGNSPISPGGKSKGDTPPTRSIRWQLLGALNLTLGSLLLVLLFLDYRREVLDVVRDKRVSLEDEAVAIHGAVVHLQENHGRAEVQAYLDSVSATTRAASTDHQIVAQLHGAIITSRAGQKGSSELERVVQNSVRAGDEPMIVGSHAREGVTVFVGEPFSPVRRSVRSGFLREIAWLCFLGVVAAIVVNVVVMRQVTRPLGRLSSLVDRITEGDFAARSEVFRSGELNRLATAFNAMSESLLASEQHRRHQMERARRIQRHLLPDRVAVPGMQIEVSFEPAEDVAGDYFDVLPLPDGSWLICVADVTGHGVPAALGAAMLKMMLADAAERLIETSEILSFLNRRCAATFLPGYFASILLARWDPAAQTLDCSSAGHEPGLLLSSNGVTPISATGLFLGVDSNERWKTVRLQVHRGDRLLLSTDGIIETRDSSHQLFGRARLGKLFEATRGVNLHESIQRIDAELGRHRENQPLTDDMTLVMAEFTGSSADRPRCSSTILELASSRSDQD